MEYNLVIPSKLTFLADVRVFLERVFEEANLNRFFFNRVYLGLSEAVQNSIVHGNHNEVCKNVSIYITYFDFNLLLTVGDEGDGFQFECIEDPTSLNHLKLESGRGIFLIRKLADNVLFENGGSRILMHFNLKE